MLCSHHAYRPDPNITRDICDLVYEFRASTLFTLFQIMLIPIIILILITLIREDKEDTKWFVFHIAILNLCGIQALAHLGHSVHPVGHPVHPVGHSVHPVGNPMHSVGHPVHPVGHPVHTNIQIIVN
uniref:Uncharacterized protein n=1 Tax=Acrobeloides nanus TaxID=290746 RepID=A0A914DN81_9BILA